MIIEMLKITHPKQVEALREFIEDILDNINEETTVDDIKVNLANFHNGLGDLSKQFTIEDGTRKGE